MNAIIFLISFLFISCQYSSADSLQNPGFGECPTANGCECESSDTCPENSECTQLNKGKYCVPQEGSTVPQFVGIDQFGNEFDLYDVAFKGKPILIEICLGGGKACNDLSAWLSHKNNLVTQKAWWKDKFLLVRDLIDRRGARLTHIKKKSMVSIILV